MAYCACESGDARCKGVFGVTIPCGFIFGDSLWSLIGFCNWLFRVQAIGMQLNILFSMMVWLALGGVLFSWDAKANALLTEEEEAFLTATPKVVIGVGESFEPFVIKNLDGSYSGYDVQIAELVSGNTGLKIEFEMDTWKDIQEKAQRKEVDGLLTAVFSEEREAFFLPSHPYLSITSLVLVKKGNPKGITKPADIEGKKIAMQRGNVLFEKVLRAITNNVEVIYFDHIYELLSAVVSGQVDLSILDETAPFVAKKIGLVDYIDVAFPVGEPISIHFLLRNDQPELRSIIDKGLSLIREEDRMRIRDRWFGMPEESLDWSLLSKIFLSVVVLFMAVLYWGFSLRAARRRAEGALAQLELKDQQLEEANRTLERLSVTDHLTHLFNRERLDEVLDSELRRANRYGAAFGVVMVDVDYFKEVNDEYGHPVGDRVLIELAEILSSNSRSVDTVGRWGGEEFLIICPELDRDGVMAVAEKLRKDIEGHQFPIIGRKTASFGVAVFKSDDEVADLMDRVDRALYLSKENGRNQTSCVL